MRSLQANGQYHVTKLGKAFFRDKHTEWLAHVPVIIRGRRRNGTPYERHDYLPVTSLDVGLSRQNDAGATRRSLAMSRRPFSGSWDSPDLTNPFT